MLSRRLFFKNTSLLGLATLPSVPLVSEPSIPTAEEPIPVEVHDQIFVAQQGPEGPHSPRALDLSPAQWIWYPSERCLANTVVLFRKTIRIDRTCIAARGWILGDSRYKLWCNAQRVQFGPAPSDPRWAEADPLDLTQQLTRGDNVIAAEVLYYGHGDGTWPIGKPGFIFWLELQYNDASKEIIVSDASWQCTIARSWQPGQYKRWYLRAFQEQFDARLYPKGFSSNRFVASAEWLSAQVLPGEAFRPAVATFYRDYLYDAQGNAAAQLRERSIPMPAESFVFVQKLSETHRLHWDISPENYFDFVVPGAFKSLGAASVSQTADRIWCFEAQADTATVLTFELAEQAVGFPFFYITAPAGTTVELLVHEAHVVGGDVLINTHFHAWTRFVCQNGRNFFETFDYESLRWIQLHIRQASGPVQVEGVGMRRLKYPWQKAPVLHCSDSTVQRVLDAAVNTLYNSAIETVVDGMARERQQYSGDGGLQLHALQYAFGEAAIYARFCNTYSQGLTLDGFFMDSWPAYDRMARLFERQLGLTEWGPLLDHGIGFNFDCFHYYWYNGEAESIREVFPRLVKFQRYLWGLRGENGLLPVENLGVTTVWMDTDSYQRQSHKQCAFNLYAVAMWQEAFAPLCEVFGQKKEAQAARQKAAELLKAVQRHFWDGHRRTYTVNLPMLSQEATPRHCERSLALALMYGLCPSQDISASALLLVQRPPELGRCYPANVGWTYWAYGKIGRGDLILEDIRGRWAKMDSVWQNNTLAEAWVSPPDSGSQWSHCSVGPLYAFYMEILGIKVQKAGFDEISIKPQLADLSEVNAQIPTRWGTIRIKATGLRGTRWLTFEIPKDIKACLVLDPRENVALPLAPEGFWLPTGKSEIGPLRYL
jgi:alpha-L-rhamnosidase